MNFRGLFRLCYINSSFFLIFKQKAGVKVIAIGVGPWVDPKELLQIADGKQENVVQVSQFKTLLEKINKIVKISCATRRLVK